MKNIMRLLAVALLVAVNFNASAQKKSDPQGVLSYNLPSTVVTLEVEALQEKFYAGPYAK